MSELKPFEDIEITEKCHCGEHLWIRESGNMDEGGFYIVKYCRANSDHTVINSNHVVIEELVKTATSTEDALNEQIEQLEGEITRLNRRHPPVKRLSLDS